MLMRDAVLRDNASGEARTVASAADALASEGMPRPLDVLGASAARGEFSVEWPAMSEELKIAAAGGPEAERLCRRKPSLWNVLAYEREWSDFSEYNDFLDEESPVFHKKRYQMDVYEELLFDEFDKLGRGSKVLDAGGGVGRAAARLAGRGCDVTLVDASPRALTAAWGRLARVGAGSYDLAWADAEDLSGAVAPRAMDAALALETLCYLNDPEAALAGIAGTVRWGGWVAFSVENMAGALAADARAAGLGSAMSAAARREITVEGELHVKYLSAGRLERMSREAGLRDAKIVCCHHVADGPLGRVIGDEHWSDPAFARRAKIVERALWKIPPRMSAGRALLVVGRVR